MIVLLLILQLGLGALARDGAVDETIRVRLRSEDSGIFTEVLNALVP